MSGTGIVYPVDAVTGAPSYTGRMLRNTIAPLVAGATAARPLGGITGVRPGTPVNTVTSSPTTYTVTPFAGLIDLEAAAISGPYPFAFNANVTGGVTAADASNPRKDAVYVQINDNAEGDGTAGTPNIKIDYLAGTVLTGGTLVISAVPARSFVIANINVPISGGGSPTVTWVAPYTVAAGAHRLAPDFATLNLTAGGYVGEKGRSLADGITYRWNGAAWKPWESDWIGYSPTLTNVAVGAGSLFGQYKFIAGDLKVEGRGILGAGFSVTGTPTLTHPASYSISTNQQNASYVLGEVDVLRPGTIEYPGRVLYNNTTSAVFNAVNAAGTYGSFANLSSTVPLTFAAADVLAWKYDFTPA